MISTRIQRIFVILAIVGIGGMLSYQTISADKTIERTRVEASPHSFYSENKPSNIANPQNVTSNKDLWENEMGKDMPEGVYRGPLFEPDKMEIDYKPRWRNEYYHDSNESDGIYGYTNLAQSVRVSSDKIMNGASEFWIQIPVDKDCLYEFNAISKGVNGNEYASKTYSSVQIFKGDSSISELETHLSRTVSFIDRPDRWDTDIYPEREGIYPEMYAPITPNNYYGQRPYVKINGVFESNTNYTIVYNLLTKDNKPQVYTTSSENFGNVEVKYRKETISDFSHRGDPSTEVSLGDPLEDDSSYNASQRLMFTIDSSESEVKSTDIKLATSFIFTSGIGESYLFGKEITVNEGDVLQFYPYVNWTNSDENNKNYISFYMPFISEDNLGKDDIGINISYSASISNPIYDNSIIISPGKINWTFSDYILFTFPKNITTFDNIHTSPTIQIRFQNKTTLTLLCHGAPYGYNRDTQMPPEFQCVGQRRFHNSKFSKIDVDKVTGIKELNSGNTRYYHNHTGSHEPYFYYPYIRAKLTEGVWMQVNSTSDSKEAYSHAFGVSEYYSNITMAMVDEENKWIVLNVNEGSPSEGEKEGMFQTDDIGKYIAWGVGGPVGGFVYNYFTGEGSSSDDDLIGKISGALKGTVSTVIKGLETVYGYIVDGLKFLWEGIKKVFNKIYTKLMKFVGWIKGIAEDIAEIGGTLAMRIAIASGFMMFMGVATAISKFIEVSDWNMMEEGQ